MVPHFQIPNAKSGIKAFFLISTVKHEDFISDLTKQERESLCAARRLIKI
jgi:hypothetical protein